jgi:hypothetical protein
MSAWQGLATEVHSAVAPQRQHIKTTGHRAVFTPQHAQRLSQFSPCSHIGAVMF